jgi:hypothetical protein
MQLVHIKRSLDCMIVCVVLRVAPSCVGRIRSGSTTGGTLVATSGETELPTVSAGSLRQAGSSRTSFPARAAADEGNLIRNGADNVQDEVVDHEEGPRAKNRLSHVSTDTYSAGSRESRPMAGNAGLGERRVRRRSDGCRPGSPRAYVQTVAKSRHTASMGGVGLLFNLFTVHCALLWRKDVERGTRNAEPKQQEHPTPAPAVLVSISVPRTARKPSVLRTTRGPPALLHGTVGYMLSTGCPSSPRPRTARHGRLAACG